MGIKLPDFSHHQTTNGNCYRERRCFDCTTNIERQAGAKQNHYTKGMKKFTNVGGNRRRRNKEVELIIVKWRMENGELEKKSNKNFFKSPCYVRSYKSKKSK
jgi:hypothetical protein